MRCLALAQAWLDLGGRVSLLSHELPLSLALRLTSEGINCICLPSDADDLTETCLHASSADWVVLDGYQFSSSFCNQLTKSTKHVLLIDDLGHLAHYDAELILNQNINAESVMYGSRSINTSLLLNVRYALLRREFHAPLLKRDHDSPCERVLVTLGGSDPENVTLKVVEALLSQKQLHVKVLVGAANPHGEILVQHCNKKNGSIELLSAVENMVALMDWAQIAISAGGTSILELAARGLPALLIVIAENQSAICLKMQQKKIMRSIGWHAHITIGELEQEISQFSSVDEKNHRAASSARSMQLVDGLGARRVVFEMLARSAISLVQVRPARLQDAKQVHDWANDPLTRAASFNQKMISWEDHKNWFASRLNENSSRLYIGEDDHQKAIGIIRFEIRDKVATISINIAPISRGKGFGVALILVSCLEILHHSSVCQIRALIKPDNRLSFKVFQRGGFQQSSDVKVAGQRTLCMTLS